MPPDIILCIFEVPDPFDLLYLAHLSKAFRRVLTSKTSISTWKSARRDTGRLPEPLHGLSKHVWAKLAFVLVCQFCYQPSAKRPEPPSAHMHCMYAITHALLVTLTPTFPSKRVGKRHPEDSCLVRDDKDMETKKLKADRLQACR
ncbi:hypothetical protein EV421DRAFT_1906524 [Armillaria borealis]|uniref:F-box domain-containing protein n=1 Tax=Armillaria borealis TaxID=47425 RepID=A0AA39JAW2_9AGAR|nr:hypothetical protein EV421DRAFT_1906524 [Armillaria borealis]